MKSVRTKEVWVPVPGSRHRYEISNRGKVRSLLVVGRKTVLKLQKQKTGYLIIGLYLRPRKQRFKYVHRLVAIAFIPNPAKLPEVNHIDGNKANNNVENLEWCDRSDNAIHAYGLGLRVVNRRGEQSHLAKVTESDVRKIRRKYATGKYTQRQLGATFGIARSVVGFIVRRETWKHVE